MVGLNGILRVGGFKGKIQNISKPLFFWNSPKGEGFAVFVFLDTNKRLKLDEKIVNFFHKFEKFLYVFLLLVIFH